MARKNDSAAWLLLAVIVMATRKSTSAGPVTAPAEVEARPAPAPRTRRKRPAALASAASGWQPMPRELVVDRALAQRGRGRYHLGGGAIYSAPDVYSPEGNNHPGTTDCTGLLAYAAMYKKGPYNTDAIIADATGLRRRFEVVPEDELVQPGDFLITNNGKLLPDHAGVVVEVLPGFVRHGKRWYRNVRVAQAAGQSWTKTINEQMEDKTGAVRVTDAYRWRHTGVFVRAKHITD